MMFVANQVLLYAKGIAKKQMKNCIYSIYIIVATLLAASLSVYAQPLLPVVRPVCGDSVVFFSRDATNWPLLALTVDRDAAPSPIAIPSKSLELQLSHWQNATLPNLNLVGGSGDATTIQGYSAMATFYEAAALWMLTGESQFIDAIERALFGGLPDAMFHSPDAMERAMAAKAMADASQMVYGTDTTGVFVNFYLNTFAHIVTPDSLDVVIDQSTTMPWGPMTRIRLSGKGREPVTLALRIRIPEWLTEKPIIYVNGHDTEYTMARGYAVIRRKWTYGDELYMTFDTTPKPCAVESGNVVRCGPVVYCTTDSLPNAGLLRIEAAAPDEQTGHPLYALKPADAGSIESAVLRPFFEATPVRRQIVFNALVADD